MHECMHVYTNVYIYICQYICVCVWFVCTQELQTAIRQAQAASLDAAQLRPARGALEEAGS